MDHSTLTEKYRPAITEMLISEWGGPMVATRGRLIDAPALPGLVALEEGQLAGCLLYELRNNECEVVLLESLTPGRGVGSGLLAAAAKMAADAGCRRLWLITTNDNTPAIRFYQRQGMRLAAAHIGAVDQARATIKPAIPQRGVDDIPIRDELEFELVF